MVDDFIARKQGKTEINYELPQLEPILADTYGVIAYQEQVMRIAATLASFTLGAVGRAAQGDGQEEPRRHAGAAREVRDRRGEERHQREEGHQDLRPDGALRRVRLQQVALDDLRVPRVPDRLPEGELPVALPAALLTIEAQNTDKVALYLGECRDRGIPVLPPDINESELRFTVDAAAACASA